MVRLSCQIRNSGTGYSSYTDEKLRLYESVVSYLVNTSSLGIRVSIIPELTVFELKYICMIRIIADPISWKIREFTEFSW